jgi:hypothetical protein
MKKKNIVFATVFTLAMAMLPACDLLEECGSCRLITLDADGNVTNEGAALPFCGDELKEKQDAPPVTVGGVTTFWDCD